MSMNLKTQNGLQPIHSVHIIPADGYTSEHDIMESIWKNDYGYTGSIAYKNCLIEHFTSGNKTGYIINSANTINLGLKLVEIDSATAPKILIDIAPTSNNGCYLRYNNMAGIYPNKRDAINSYLMPYSTGGEFIINQSAFGTIHPAIVNKNIQNNAWLPKTKDLFLYDFYELITLTGYTFTGEEKLILAISIDSSYYNLWIIPDDTTFTIDSTIMENMLKPNKSLRKWELSKSSYFGNNIRTGKITINIYGGGYMSTMIPISTILASTFDIKLTDETLVYSKNADVSDFVELT